MNAFMNCSVTGRGRGSEPGGRRGGQHPVLVGHREVQHRPVRHVPIAAAQPPAGVCHHVWAAGVGALPPPDGHVGGQHPLLGGPRGVGVGGVFDEDILMSSCGMNPPPRLAPAAPPQQSPPPPRNPNPLPRPPPNPRKARSAHRRASPSNRAAARRRTRNFTVPMGRGRGSEEPPSLEGDESPDPLLGEHVFVLYLDGVYPGVVTSVVAGWGG